MKPTIDSKTRESVPVVRGKPTTYQPSKAELDEDLSIPNVTAEDLARACLRSVTIVEER